VSVRVRLTDSHESRFHSSVDTCFDPAPVSSVMDAVSGSSQPAASAL